MKAVVTHFEVISLHLSGGVEDPPPSKINPQSE
jgi:hypothetical protein